MTKNYKIENYISNNNPTHHNDIPWKDEAQREVYEFCKKFMEDNNFKSVIDVGCGSGYKLIKYLNNFNTIGIETEPCYSYLKKTYPNSKWLLSGEEEKSFIEYNDIKNSDVIICSDVIEHIVDPDILVDYLISLNAKYYIISTPCRFMLCHHPRHAHIYNISWKGPPSNTGHVREWTMNEFKDYLNDKFNILFSTYSQDQIECQYHLLEIKKN